MRVVNRSDLQFLFQQQILKREKLDEITMRNNN